MMVLAASMGGVSVDQVDRATINMVISGTSIGTIWQVRVAALLLVLYFSIVGWRRPAFALGSLSVTAAIALATLALTGHRKSVVEGKSVSVRLDLGGCRIIKKKKMKT